jgi:hypothetical protein
MSAPFITEEQADAIVEQLFRVIVDSVVPYVDGKHWQESDVSKVALIVCDAVTEDITLQPLHHAYRRAKDKRGIVFSVIGGGSK